MCSSDLNLRKLIKKIEFVGKNSRITTLDCILRDGDKGKGKPEEIVSYLLNIDSSERNKLLDLKILKMASYISGETELVLPMDRDYYRVY